MFVSQLNGQTQMKTDFACYLLAIISSFYSSLFKQSNIKQEGYSKDKSNLDIFLYLQKNKLGRTHSQINVNVIVKKSFKNSKTFMFDFLSSNISIILKH